MVSAAVNEHYGSEHAVQIEYAPYGQPTGLCTAVAVTAHQDEGLSLQPCSAPGTTVWIIDTADSPATAPTYFPIVNGSDTDFVHPFAMTILGNPAHQLFTPIIMQHLTGKPRQRARQPAVGRPLRVRLLTNQRWAAPGRGGPGPSPVHAARILPGAAAAARTRPWISARTAWPGLDQSATPPAGPDRGCPGVLLGPAGPEHGRHRAHLRLGHGDSAAVHRGRRHRPEFSSARQPDLIPQPWPTSSSRAVHLHRPVRPVRFNRKARTCSGPVLPPSRAS